MTIRKSLGGDRIGSGNKMNVSLHNYERSTHDLSSIWRSTMAPGTLVPFMKKIALPGDNWEIDLEADVMTYPTVGPLFASFKLQLDVFLCPIRLYQGKLHNNALGIGMNMDKVKLPLLEIKCNNIDQESDIPVEFQQINQSSLLAYLGIRGIGRGKDPVVRRDFNAIPYLAYWDIYKNYYANKQEEIGACIHTDKDEGVITKAVYFLEGSSSQNNIAVKGTINENENYGGTSTETARVIVTGEKLNPDNIYTAGYSSNWNELSFWQRLSNYFNTITITETGLIFENPKKPGATLGRMQYIRSGSNEPVNVQTFKLENLDDMRNDLLLEAKKTNAFKVTKNTYSPYGLPLQQIEGNKIASFYPLEGLAVKTYQSDIFNNWLSTEWLENEEGTGINQITAVSTQGDNFQIDALILAKKVYDMLNRIAVSGGSYNDWVEAVWAHESYKRAESPIYMGGLSREVVFQEVVSNAKTEGEPLGSLAGKGKLSDKRKGGYLEIKVDEPSYIIGIVSLTPRIDYSQGNEWDVNLKTMDDLHKPALDGIGFQELITDQMAFWDTEVNDLGTVTFKSAGKVPAWINYMTDFNKSYGNFADPDKEMFMTLNRRYQMQEDGSIKDLTTYIDPAKYNYMFAVTERNAQNFWVQIANNITARRKMSAKVIPNL